jgi:hypothetical protein
MNSTEIETIKKATIQVEAGLKEVEEILDATNNQALYQASLSMVAVLRHLHQVDPTLLNTQNRERIEAILLKEKVKSGRDSFNTGF